MARSKDQDTAIKKRTKLAECADPMATPDAVAPKEGTSARFFWEYGQAFARGISKATNRPTTAPVVAGPTSIMVQLLRAHCKDESGVLLKGAAVLEWLENVVHDFRSQADEREYGRGRMGWSPNEFARWLDNGRPVANAPRPGAAAARAHIAVKKA